MLLRVPCTSPFLLVVLSQGARPSRHPQVYEKHQILLVVLEVLRILCLHGSHTKDPLKKDGCTTRTWSTAIAELVPKTQPILLYQSDEPRASAIVRVQQELRQRTNLRCSIPTIRTVNHDCHSAHMQNASHQQPCVGDTTAVIHPARLAHFLHPITLGTDALNESCKGLPGRPHRVDVAQFQLQQLRLHGLSTRRDVLVPINTLLPSIGQAVRVRSGTCPTVKEHETCITSCSESCRFQQLPICLGGRRVPAMIKK
mmetsp:Transcript_62488/g.165820  ORF Transcript_62488/g.165820 Transcript_62488/m.165820 type:complete len:256 (-) Transcript_62488:506-1273(-)